MNVSFKKMATVIGVAAYLVVLVVGATREREEPIPYETPGPAIQVPVEKTVALNLLASCGNGKCEEWSETYISCPQDCGEQQVKVPRKPMINNCGKPNSVKQHDDEFVGACGE